jgi:hypothetical protein
MFVRTLFLSAFLAAATLAPAQQQPGDMLPPVVKTYLELTTAQASALNQINGDYQALVERKQSRIVQVNQEISEETAREPLDPMGLGVRYAELEAIRRELKDELGRVRVKARAVLTPAQAAKLKALEDAAKLKPVVDASICANLIDPGTLQTQTTGAFATFLLGTTAISPAVNYCYSSGGYFIYDPYNPGARPPATR